MKNIIILVILILGNLMVFNELNAQIVFSEQDYYLRFSHGSWATAPIHDDLNLENEFTIESWVYFEKQVDGMILKKGLKNYDDIDISYALRIIRDKYIGFIQTHGSTAASVELNALDTFKLRTWTHVALTFINNTFHLYVNSEFQGSIESIGPIMNDSLPITIGGFNGIVGPTKIWNKALTESELIASATNSSTGEESGLISYWPMDEGKGQVCNNLVSESLNLVLGSEEKKDYGDGTWVSNEVLKNEPFYEFTEFEYNSPHTIEEGFFHELDFIDFDQDGDLDLLGVMATTTPNPVHAFRNDGLGNFSDATLEVFNNNLVDVINPNKSIVADFNGDGLDDYFISDQGYDWPPYAGNRNTLLIQTEDGHLVDETDMRIEHNIQFTHDAAVADIDNDGDLDIYEFNLGPGTDPNNCGDRLLINDGNGYFTKETNRLPDEIAKFNIPVAGGKFFDLNKDGNLDLIIGGPDSLLLGVDNGHFKWAPGNSIPTPTWNGYHWIYNLFKVEDITGDGYKDIIMKFYTHDVDEYEVRLLINDKNGRFEMDTTEGLDFHNVMDINNDGWLDFISIGYNEETSVFMNKGDGKFVNSAGLISYKGLSSYADIDNDGDTDIVIYSNNGPYRFIIGKNIKQFDIGSKALDVPKAPTLTDPVSNDKVGISHKFNWTDNDFSLYFQLQISSVSDFSSVALERKKLTTNSFFVNDLKHDSTYFWRVRGINTAGTGNWSETLTFTCDTLLNPPVLTAPHFLKEVQIELTLSWEEASLAQSYILQVSKSNDFPESGLYQDDLSSTSYNLSELDYLQHYYWRVKAVWENDTSAWSEVGLFKTQYPNPPKQSNYLAFSIDDIAIAPQNDQLKLAHPFTLEAWVNLTERHDGVIISNYHGEGHPFDQAYQLDLNFAGHDFLFLYNGEEESASRLESKDSIELNKWYHVVVISNDKLNYRMFVNGIEAMAPTDNLGLTASNDLPMVVGNVLNSSGFADAGIDGIIAQVKVWNKTQNISDIISNAGNYLTGSEEGLIAYWPMDDGRGQIARDLTSNSFDLMLGETIETDQRDPVWQNADTIIASIEQEVQMNENDRTIKLYPNPTTGKLFIELNQPEETFDIEIFSVDGSLLLSKKLISSLDNSLDIAHLENGLYIVNIKYDGAVITKKVVVKK